MQQQRLPWPSSTGGPFLSWNSWLARGCLVLLKGMQAQGVRACVDIVEPVLSHWHPRVVVSLAPVDPLSLDLKDSHSYEKQPKPAIVRTE